MEMVHLTASLLHRFSSSSLRTYTESLELEVERGDWTREKAKKILQMMRGRGEEEEDGNRKVC